MSARSAWLSSGTKLVGAAVGPGLGTGVGALVGGVETVGGYVSFVVGASVTLGDGVGSNDGGSVGGAGVGCGVGSYAKLSPSVISRAARHGAASSHHQHRPAREPGGHLSPPKSAEISPANPRILHAGP